MLVLGATVGRKSIPIPFLGSAENQNIAFFSLERAGFYGFGTSKSFGGVLTIKAVAL
jgi:hypothetical protein